MNNNPHPIFVNAGLGKASVENKRNALVIQRPDSQDVNYVQVAGLIARRIFCYVHSDGQLKKGQRYRLIRFWFAHRCLPSFECKAQDISGRKNLYTGNGFGRIMTFIPYMR